MAKTDVMLCFLILLGFFDCNVAIDIRTPGDIGAAISSSTGAADSIDLKKSLKIMDLNRRFRDEIKKAFQILDKNGDGSIDVEELKPVLQCFSPQGTAVSDAESKALLANVDLNGDVELGPDGLIHVYLKLFNFDDKNNNDSIDFKELKFILQCFSPQGTAVSDAESKAILADVDLNGDFELGLYEFWALVAKILLRSCR